MMCAKLRALVLLIAVAAQASFSATDVQAGPIADFFFGPQTTTTAYRPYATAYRPAYSTYYRATPTTVYRATPTTVNYGGDCCGTESYGNYYTNAYTADACDPCGGSYQPQACAPQTCAPQTYAPQAYAPQAYAPQTYQPAPSIPRASTVPGPTAIAVPERQRLFPRLFPRLRGGGTGGNVGYLPSNSYRSQWIRVPVTYYRPAVTADPTTGAQVTAMRPCTTTQWQLQRVPVTTARRPFLSRLFGTRRTPAVVAPTYNYGMYANASPAYSSGTSTGCSSCAPGSSMTLAPAMTSPSTSGGAITTPAPSGMPADQPPSFDQLRARTQGASSPSSSDVYRQRVAPQLPPARPHSLDVKPVPDPDGARRPFTPIEPPPLLDPQSKTASFPVRQAWAATPITWPTATARQVVDSAASENTNEIKWDTGGWTSVNN